MNRFFVKEKDVNGKRLWIRGREARHALKVLRLKPGDPIEAIDGYGSTYHGTMAEVESDSFRVEVSSKTEKKKKRKYLSLAVSLLKGDRMDWVLQKLTELGVDEIIPFMSERTVVRISKEQAVHRLARWQRIIQSACKQSSRSEWPKLNHPVFFLDLLNQIDSYDLFLLPCLSENTLPLPMILEKNPFNRILVAVGPEGDFTLKERDLAQLKGAHLVSLGDLTLRSETAALFVSSIIKFLS